MHSKFKIIKYAGIILIIIIGVVHLLDAKDSFNDAAYKGCLFIANGVGSFLAAFFIYRGNKWGWDMGFLIAVASFGGYIASRTIGLPFIPAEPGAWFEPLGVVAMAAEAAFITLRITFK
ncbi:MAG: hypothetical protein KGK03_11230, partial [Candidatus Omnitrophica bacterium]|nr:hypothetical protein [Candidatus Omnitrophota bacterium]MDE2223630.1 hypothetical protein [Candidatus Omnitrophota bacterium]